MPLGDSRTRTRERFNDVRAFLSYIGSLEPAPPNVVPQHVNTMKGLFYVHLYAAFEKSINDIVESSLLIVSSSSVKKKHFVPQVSALVCNDKLKSIRDSAQNKMSKKSADMFLELFSDSIGNIDEAIFSRQLQNVWMNTIDDVLHCLGCIEPSFTARDRAVVDEIVERRNAVAHGREAADLVGQRFRTSDLRSKLDCLYEVTLSVLRVIEDHCTNKKFIRPNVRRYYK